MLFGSWVYGVFLFATYGVFWLLRGRHVPRTAFLVAASYFFYFYGTFDTATNADEPPPLGPWGWSVLCLGIIFVGSTLDFQIGRLLGRIDDPRKRKALLLVSLVYYLGVLAVFKYFDFAADSFAAALGLLGVHVTPAHLGLVLPFGISFFTFETMSYTIDVYRRELPPAERYLDYLAFVCFFPHLVAGPIVRPHAMLPQLAAEPRADDARKLRGLSLVATGLLKKIAIGDVLAVNLVGRVFDNPERYSSFEVLVAVYGYAIQIYADFSGYSDVAIGSAHLFGYELPPNFDAPYLSRNLQEFWRRWHISLSSWLRDYLYIPLGGSKHGTWKTYRNLFVTMLLGGLWHGASWTFVIWGALHGVGLAANRAFQRARGDREGGAARPSTWAVVLTTIATFHFVCFCWIFFRAPSFAHATLVLGRLARGTVATTNLSAQALGALAAGFALHLLPRSVEVRARERFVSSSFVVQGALLAACAYALHFAMGARAEPFVYGQF